MYCIRTFYSIPFVKSTFIKWHLQCQNKCDLWSQNKCTLKVRVHSFTTWTHKVRMNVMYKVRINVLQTISIELYSWQEFCLDQEDSDTTILFWVHSFWQNSCLLYIHALSWSGGFGYHELVRREPASAGTLRHTATHRNTLQHTYTTNLYVGDLHPQAHCNTHCNTPTPRTMYVGNLHPQAHCNTLQHILQHILQHTAANLHHELVRR